MGYFNADHYRLNTAFSSGDEYATPAPTYEFWRDYFIRRGWGAFTVDAAASAANHKTPRFYSKRDNGLVQDYRREVAWLNPPFARGALPKWTTMLVAACGAGATFGVLLPNWLNDGWAVENVMPHASELHFIPGRIRFHGANGRPDFAPTFGSIFVVWLPGLRKPGTDLKVYFTRCPLKEELTTWDESRRPPVIRDRAERISLRPVFPMRVLVACEISGRVRDAFIRQGHDAISCDLLPSDVVGPHLRCDVRDVLDQGWDLMIAHPPCTHLSVSGAAWFKDKQREQKEALEFVRALLNAPIPRIALENPVSIISSEIRQPDQIIQPWMFSHGETKKTCLWLKNLPRLMPSEIVSGREPRIQMMPPSPNRAKLRGLTYQGIADAMALQWSPKKPAP
jgi:hypothetical protein